MNERGRFLALAALAFAAALGGGWAIGTFWHRPAPAPLDAPASKSRGAVVFQANCASCHGPDGHGDGANRAALHPPPRDFAARPWRFEPTPASIRRVTVEGIPASAMPAFAATLSTADLDAVVAHVYELAKRDPSAAPVPTEEERLLRDAGFIDVRGADPPPLTLGDAGGKTVKLSELRGQLVLLHFWGTGCVHCIAEMPALSALAKAHGGRLAVFNVCTDQDDPAAAQKTLDRLAPGAIAFTEPTGLGLARFEVNAVPTTWLIDPAGKAIGRATGAKNWQSEALQKLIGHFAPKKSA